MGKTPPSVTIVVAPRERFNYTRQSLNSIYNNTSFPFQLVYVDGNSPLKIKNILEKESVKRKFLLLRKDHYLSPNQARNLGQQHVNTKYVVFVDNDLTVKKGWLEHLVDCAEKTDAWVVGPLYFQGFEEDKIIHMAGGDAHFTEKNGVRDFYRKHRFVCSRYVEVKDQLKREQTETIEFHCALVKNEVFDRIGPLDEEFLSSSEHLDFALTVRDAGGTIYFEPQAMVTYNSGLLDKSDMEFTLLRWSEDWNRRSVDRFAAKWNLSPGSAFASSKLMWCSKHRESLHKYQRTPLRVAWQYLTRLGRRVLGPTRYNNLYLFYRNSPLRFKA